MSSRRASTNSSPDEVANRRLEDINEFESILADNDVLILKFYLHISRDEQTRRLQARIDDKKKNWKLSDADIHERQFWPQYMEAYNDILSSTSRKHAPWFVIPSDNKWYRNVAISDIIVDAHAEPQTKIPPTHRRRLRHQALGAPARLPDSASRRSFASNRDPALTRHLDRSRAVSLLDMERSPYLPVILRRRRRTFFCTCFCLFFPNPQQNRPTKNRHFDRSDGQSHRPPRSGETPAFALFCICRCFFLCF